MLLTALSIAKYYISKDREHKLFTNKVIEINGVKSYEGNVRINKYLFLSQVVYLAKYGKKLFSDDLVAYTNGPVVIDIINNYTVLYSKKSNDKIDSKTKDFLDKIYFSLENATCEELIDISHEDPEWQRLSLNTYSKEVMDLEAHIEYYKETYKGLIEALGL